MVMVKSPVSDRARPVTVLIMMRAISLNSLLLWVSITLLRLLLATDTFAPLRMKVYL